MYLNLQRETSNSTKVLLSHNILSMILHVPRMVNVWVHFVVSVPVASPAVVNSEPVSVPGLSIPQQTAAVVQHTPNVRANAIPPQTLATPQQSNTVAPSFSNVPQQAAAVVQPAPSAVPQPQVTTRGPPTKAELKRLQWEKERGRISHMKCLIYCHKILSSLA